jgi:superfamily I DNA and/or RNA helicase
LDIIQEFTKKYPLGTVVKTYVAKIIPPSQVVTTFDGDYIGRISIIDLEWSFPQAEVTFSNLEVGRPIECVITGIDHQNRQVMLNRKFLESAPSDTTDWDRVSRGDEYQAKIVYSLYSRYLVQTIEGIYGLLPKEVYQGSETQLRVRVSEKLEYSNLFSFVSASSFQELPSDKIPLSREFSFIEEELSSYQSFKNSILGNNANNEDHELIKKGFEHDPKIFSQEMGFAHPLYIQFDRNSNAYDFEFKQQAFAYFFPGETIDGEKEQKLLEKFSKEQYWLKINRFQKNREIGVFTNDFSLYNEEINFYGHIQFGKRGKDIKFSIKKFSIGQDFAGTAEKKKANSKMGSFLYSSSIIVLSPNGNPPLGDSQVELFEYMLLKSDCFHRVQALKRASGEILRQEGKTLAIIDKFLEYQINLLDNQKELNAFVDSYKQVPSGSGGIAIEISSSAGDTLEMEEGCVVNVRLKQPSLRNSHEHELTLLSEARVTSLADNYILTFSREIKLSLLDTGFYIDKRISKKQFTLQRSIIQDFLEKKIKIDHIESMLIKRNKINTPQIPIIKFKNPDLVRTEKDQPDNNQVAAVKKAIGNQNIFLIQGPPGTGKTTVIAEIIQQLTDQGEKILVAGQNHVAVDNVLEKIAKEPRINLLRVGNPDRVDPNLVKFNIEHLAEDYKIDFRLFLKNQVSLAKDYLEMLLTGLTRNEIHTFFNAQVIDFSERYEKLQLVYKERHFVFRDTLASLTAAEIEKSISALENWISSIQSEYETLLKPLIYSNVDVVFATCIGIKTDQVFKYSSFKFDTVIIDEAGKANIAESLVAMELGKKVILVGDQMQLPPYMDSALIDEKDPESFPRSRFGSDFQVSEIAHALKTSFFEFIINRIHTQEFPKENLELLNYQHRMHPNIGEFISKAFYNGEVRMGSRTHLNHLALPAPFDKEIIFFDTSNSVNPYEQNDGFSAKNNLEAESIADSILPALFNNSISPQNIAVIAPYKSQVANIKRFISSSSVCKFKNIDVSTLDSFQGMEYDIIVFSFTRSVNHKLSQKIDGKFKFTKVGFLDDARRLNVAFSRAKKKLILIGNSVTLSDKKSHFDGLFNYTQLFETLIKLSKEEAIGNFVNIADFKENGGFQALSSKLTIGSVTRAKVKNLGINKEKGNIFGLFLTIDGQNCLAPKSLNTDLNSYSPDEEVNVEIIKIHHTEKRITVKILPESWENFAAKLVIGEYLTGEVVKSYPSGWLIRISPRLAGMLLHQNRRAPLLLDPGQIVQVAVKEIDFSAKRIILKM